MKNKIYIIGMGPGKEEMMTEQALQALDNSDVIIGYTVYVELLGERFAGKEMRTTPMRREAERCRLCFEEAAKGKQVALICSGDAGIYGLASLMYEIGKEYPKTLWQMKKEAFLNWGHPRGTGDCGRRSAVICTAAEGWNVRPPRLS